MNLAIDYGPFDDVLFALSLVGLALMLLALLQVVRETRQMCRKEAMRRDLRDALGWHATLYARMHGRPGESTRKSLRRGF